MSAKTRSCIVVIEDNPREAEYLTKFIDNSDLTLTVDYYLTHSQAERALRRGGNDYASQIGCVLLDLVDKDKGLRPGLDILQSFGQKYRIPIIVITAYRKLAGIEPDGVAPLFVLDKPDSFSDSPQYQDKLARFNDRLLQMIKAAIVVNNRYEGDRSEPLPQAGSHESHSRGKAIKNILKLLGDLSTISTGIRYIVLLVLLSSVLIYTLFEKFGEKVVQDVIDFVTK